MGMNAIKELNRNEIMWSDNSNAVTTFAFEIKFVLTSIVHHFKTII